jgi:cytosine deaminase
MVSAMGAAADPPAGTDAVFATYLRAKAAADDDLRRRSALDWTILRPGLLTNDPATGRVHLAASTGSGSVSRDDVAAVLAELIDTPSTAGLTLELIAGHTPVAVAVKDVSGN